MKGNLLLVGFDVGMRCGGIRILGGNLEWLSHRCRVVLILGYRRHDRVAQLAPYCSRDLLLFGMATASKTSIEMKGKSVRSAENL